MCWELLNQAFPDWLVDRVADAIPINLGAITKSRIAGNLLAKLVNKFIKLRQTGLYIEVTQVKHTTMAICLGIQASDQLVLPQYG